MAAVPSVSRAAGICTICTPLRDANIPPDSSCLPLPRKSKLENGVVRTKSRSQSRLSTKWREVQGADNWLGLIPAKSDYCELDVDACQFSRSCRMDEELRREILKYGGMAQACYDAFDSDNQSRGRGNCKYDRAELLPKTGASSFAKGYEITKYLYATTDLELPRIFSRAKRDGDEWSRDSNWMGFVAVSRPSLTAEIGRRDIVIAWRGTVTGVEWLVDLQDFLMPVGLDTRDRSTDGVKVESGFLDVYTASKQRSRYNKLSARQQLICEIQRLIREFQGEEMSITVTGHSLGGALALLSAYDLAELGIAGDKTQIPATVFNFSAPRVGNRRFAERCEQLNLKVMRVVNKRDIVPKVPGILFNEKHGRWMRGVREMIPWAYSHVGTEVELDSGMSPYLRRDADVTGWHNLEGLLHLVDGYHGPYDAFELSGMRSLALVNKDADLLDPTIGIPRFWGRIHKQCSL